MRTEALETDLDDASGLLLEVEQLGEVVQRRHRRLLQVDIGAGGEGGAGQREVRAQRRRDHHHIHGADRGQGLVQIGVQVRAVDDRRVQDDSRVDGGDQLDQTLVGEPGDPVGVDLAEPAYADQDQACGRGNRTWARRKSRLILAFERGETDAIRTRD